MEFFSRDSKLIYPNYIPWFHLPHTQVNWALNSSWGMPVLPVSCFCFFCILLKSPQPPACTEILASLYLHHNCKASLVSMTPPCGTDCIHLFIIKLQLFVHFIFPARLKLLKGSNCILFFSESLKAMQFCVHINIWEVTKWSDRSSGIEMQGPGAWATLCPCLGLESGEFWRSSLEKGNTMEHSGTNLKLSPTW